MIEKLKAMFNGKKTKVVAGALVALAAAMFFGVIELDPEQMAAIVVALVGVGKFTMRLAIEKLAEE